MRDFCELHAAAARRVRPAGDAEPDRARRAWSASAPSARTTPSSGALTGPVLRAAGLEWDLRKQRPYGGYEQFEFDVPTGTTGDCYDRMAVHVEEMRQSLRIIEQCVEQHAGGAVQGRPPAGHAAAQGAHDARHRDADQPLPGRELGAGDPARRGGGAHRGRPRATTATTCVSDGGTSAYRTRIRTPSFPHLQMLPLLCRGLEIPDLVTILGQHRLRDGGRGPVRAAMKRMS